MSTNIDVNTPEPFAQRPWPQRPPENSPFRRYTCLALVVDQPRTLAQVLTLAGLPTEAPKSSESPAEAMARRPWDMIIVDPEHQQILSSDDKVLDSCTSVILGIGEGSDEGPLRVYSWLPKACQPTELLQAFGHALEQVSLRDENDSLREKLRESLGFEGFHSVDPRMDAVLDTAKAIAPSRATVLILGESGTGKTRLARTLHENSDRRDGPFTVVNCGALPSALLESELFGHAKGAFTGAVRDKPGRFEDADGGTIFLDEINSAPLELQVKLLRVIQERELERVGENQTRQVDVRIIAASNQDLEQAIEVGEFREDLYWRLNVVSLSLPPLRERPLDLARLIETFLKRFSEEYDRATPRPDAEALEILGSYDWPGNIRQLENVIERGVLLAGGDRLGLSALPADLIRAARQCGASQPETSLELGLRTLQAIIPLKLALEGPEKAILVHALEATQGNRKKAAKELGINRTTLFNKMRKHDLMDQEFGLS